MKKGDIVLIPFPFTDLTGTKIRPGLVLIASKKDIVVAFITTQLHLKENTDIVITPSTENGVKKISVLRLSKLATIDSDLAIGKIGAAEVYIMLQIDKNLKDIFQLT